MSQIAYPRWGLARCLTLAAATMLLLTAAPSQRAEAKSPFSSPLASGMTSTVDDAADGGLVTLVRGGGHGGGGGGHMGGGGGHMGGGGGHMGGGMHYGGGMHVGGYHGGGYHAGGFHGGPMYHHGGFHHGGFRFAHHHHRHFFGGYYYPSDYYYHPRCRIVWTAYGRHRVCYHRHWHRYHHWHRRHHWHHRHYY
jgi:hypothetical protein